MSQDNWIGAPDKHDTWNASPAAHEPPEGGIERRLCKIEYYQNEVKTALEVLQVSNADGEIYCPCKACGDGLANGTTQVQFPICDDCLDMIGTMTRARKKLKFLG